MKIRSICGAEPHRDGEYPWAYVIGSDGVTAIHTRRENFGTYAILWFLVMCGDQEIASMNALHVAHVGYEPIKDQKA